MHIMEIGLTLLLYANLPLFLWVEAFLTAVFLINRLSSSVLKMATPFAKLYGEQPDYNSLKVFGCRCFPYIKGSSKFNPKTYPCVFIGYDSLHKVYRCYHPSRRRAYISRHVVFNENTLPYVSPNQSHTNIDVSTHLATFVESFSKLQAYDNSGEVQADSTQVTGDNATIKTPILLNDESTIDLSSAGSDDDHEKQVDSDDPYGPIQLPTLIDVPVDHQPDDTTLKSITLVDVLVEVLPTPQGHYMITRHKANEHHLSLVARRNKEILKEPNTNKEALGSPHWLAIMQEEINALHTNKTWILVPKSPGINLVGSKWVFKTKLKADGTIDRYKAKLVAREFSQLEGVDFEETFSPVVKATTIRMVLSIAALYGLKQAPRAWFDRFSMHLLHLGFICSKANPSLFTLQTYKGSNPSHDSELVLQLGNEFAMIDLGLLHFFLGIEVKYFEGGIHLSQSKYVVELLAKIEMTLAKAVATPLAQEHGLREAVGSLIDASLCRMIVESLQYLTLTRPDITHVVNLASQFMQSPNIEHLQGVKRSLREVVPPLGDQLQARSSVEAEYRALASTVAEMTWIMYLFHDLGVFL
ncbi:hypothetical protein KY285_010656 [Solanum tuberosum]|nr:hypothetical protein KY285_010656 [Solanum tuberosum]